MQVSFYDREFYRVDILRWQTKRRYSTRQTGGGGVGECEGSCPGRRVSGRLTFVVVVILLGLDIFYII